MKKLGVVRIDKVLHTRVQNACDEGEFGIENVYKVVLYSFKQVAPEQLHPLAGGMMGAVQPAQPYKR